MTQETKKMIEQEAEEMYPLSIGDVRIRVANRQGYIFGATKYAEEVERLREALRNICNKFQSAWEKEEILSPFLYDINSIAQQALTPLDSPV